MPPRVRPLPPEKQAPEFLVRELEFADPGVSGLAGARLALELVEVNDGAAGLRTAVSVRAVSKDGGGAESAAPEAHPGAALLRNALLGESCLVRDEEPPAGSGTERHLVSCLPAEAAPERQRAALEEVRRRSRRCWGRRPPWRPGPGSSRKAASTCCGGMSARTSETPSGPGWSGGSAD
ncbi:hypothetical protein QMA10_10115 [Arthrobacter sp. APC 3897]|uniref:hypothetical protein n=1 Tax=Arthrobacter sp. APC 3897 TaxID=3035204 RepID=UPI0025B2FF50|nr:hypothetical protein [Arthrobacter sp. APC 3897]MDN3482272.1 hypothetical protein [Arthrobacter sp. APC 3897]